MDLKTFKTDLTYFCKKAQKDGKVLTGECDNLSVDAEGKFVLEGTQAHPLEFFVVGKGYLPTSEMMRVVDVPDFLKKALGLPDTCRYCDVYNIYASEMVAMHTQIAEKDLISFMQGFENYAHPVDEWYNLGVYIREKFAPVGISATLVTPKVYQPSVKDGGIRKFYYVNTKKNFGVYQVALSKLFSPWLKPGEEKFVVQSPEFLKGEELISWSIYDTPETCTERAKESIRSGFAAGLRKRNIAYTEEDVQQSIAQLKVIML